MNAARKSINHALRKLHDLLKDCSQINPEYFGKVLSVDNGRTITYNEIQRTQVLAVSGAAYLQRIKSGTYTNEKDT